jgi:excisionase family DNA binding protein
MEEEQLLRPRDVAHILDCCPDDLYPLIYAGEIKAQKVGRLWKFRMKDVMDFKDRVNGNAPRTGQVQKVNSKQPRN